MATTPQTRSIKGGKPIGRQQAALRRKSSQMAAYWPHLRRRKHAQTLKSCGKAFAERRAATLARKNIG